MTRPPDSQFTGIPFKHGGRVREDGLDCVGLALLFLASEFPEMRFDPPAAPPSGTLEEALQGCEFREASELARGDLIFFRDTRRNNRIGHVAVWLGDGKLLNTVWPFDSRIENGFTFMRRHGLQAWARVPAAEAPRLAPFLGGLGAEWVVALVLLVVSIALSVISYALAPKPTLGRLNSKGRYASDALVTQNSPEIPLADLLGSVVVAGNSIYSQVQNKGATITDPTLTRSNKVVIFASGPSELIDHQTGLQINGLAWNDKFFKNTSAADGYYDAPAQTKAEAVSGTMGSSTYVPNFTRYNGAYGIAVPVDVRAQYDRDFPLYGFTGCSYVVFRIINSTKYSQFNVTCRVKCRKCRTFDASGFVRTTVTGESLTGANQWTAQSVTASSGTEKITLTGHGLTAGQRVKFAGTAVPGGLVADEWYFVRDVETDAFKVAAYKEGDAINLTSTGTSVTLTSEGKTRFKLAHEDIASVTSLIVGGSGVTELEDANGDGTTSGTYLLNRTKGYVELLTAPTAGAAITITYLYYARAWSQNPALHLVYLLTEKVRGKGFDESRIDWAAAVALRDHCDASVTWRSADKQVTEARYRTNYAVDFRKPIQDHLRALLDACYGYLMLSNGRFVMAARTASGSVFSFTEANIIEDSFSSALLERAERANRIKVLFHSEESLNAETSVIADDMADQRTRSDRAGNNGVVDENLKIPAITSVSQAERLAEMHLRAEVGTRWTVDLITSTKGLALQPGDVVDVTHSSQPSWAAKLFRVEDLSDTEDGRIRARLIEHGAEVFI